MVFGIGPRRRDFLLGPICIPPLLPAGNPFYPAELMAASLPIISKENPMTRKRFISALLLTTLAALAAFGCEKQAPEVPKPGPTPPGGTTATGGPANGQKFKVVFIPKNTGNPFFDVVSEGFKKSASELGFDYDMVGPASGDATSQIPIIKAQIQQGVNAIAISA